MKIATTLLASALLGAMAGAWAENATVEAVQYPAWLDRGGSTVPLTPGTALWRTTSFALAAMPGCR